MAKTIKFNLICDNNPIRTIEDLQENFSIEDVLNYYQNGLLLRWLKVRGYDDEYQKVLEINDIEEIEIIKDLIKIFDIEADDKKIEEGVYMLQFLKERKELCEAYKEDGFKSHSIVDDYQTGYKQLVDGIVSNPNDIAQIKSNIAEIVTNYSWALELNHRELFWELKRNSILAVMCLLMNEGTRKYYLPLPVNQEDNDDAHSDYLSLPEKREDGTVIPKLDIESNTDKRNMYEAICRIIKQSDFISKLGENVHVFAGITDGYWKDLETKERRYMIISMGSGDFVRSAGLQGGDLSSVDIENRFQIIEGIDYKSNSAARQLIYMEV